MSMGQRCFTASADLKQTPLYGGQGLGSYKHSPLPGLPVRAPKPLWN